MNWATGVPARSTVPGKSTRRHHIGVDVPAPSDCSSSAIPRVSLATGPQRRIVQRHFKPSQACQACVFLCIQCLPGHPWMEFVCLRDCPPRSRFQAKSSALTTECRGRGSTCKGNTQLHASVDAAHEASQAAVPYSLATRGAPTSPFDREGGAPTIHLQHNYPTPSDSVWSQTNLFQNAHGCNWQGADSYTRVCLVTS